MSPRPQLLLVTRNLPPLRGGMERLNARMAKELAQSYDVTVLAPKGSSPLGDEITLRTSPVGGLAGYLAWVALAGMIEAVRSRPKWVLGGSGLVAPAVWLAARMARARMALYVHGLDLVVDNALYRLAWLPVIRRADRIIANSANTARLVRAAGVPGARVRVVNPGTSLPDVIVPAELAASFRTRRGLADARILLSVGRLTARKGLAAFVDLVLPRIVSSTPSAVLVVIGDDAQDALSGGDTSQRALAQAAAARRDLTEHVRFLGPVEEEELIAAYAASDVHVFPVREMRGDVEGFGMVAIEAAAHGLPTVATRVGGVPDAVSEGASGFLVSPDDSDAFARAVHLVLEAGRDRFSEQARDFAAGFAWPRFGEGVRSALEDRS